MFIITDHKSIVGLSRNVGQASENDTLLVEVSLTVPSLSVFLKREVIEVTVAIHTTRCEAHVIVEPIDRPDFVGVTFALHIGWALVRVEVVNVNCTGAYSSSEHVTTVGKPNFTTTLQLETGRVLFNPL